jgi:methylglutaconyl-CoA hydratase
MFFLLRPAEFPLSLHRLRLVRLASSALCLYSSAVPYSTLVLQIEAEVATITLSRPEKRNAISTEMIEDLLAALAEAESSPARVVILTGAGKAFCSGMDLDALKALTQQSPEQNLEDSKRMARMFRCLWSYSKPLIAAVNGPAIAGGCAIATLCDFTLAVPEAKFGYTEVRIGFIPAIVSVFLIRQIGEKRARDLLLTGRILDAAEAQEIGLVTEVVPPEQLMDSARELAAALIASSPTSLARTKQLLCRYAEDEIDRQLALAIEENARIRSTADFREGLASFLEKRKPNWSGT